MNLQKTVKFVKDLNQATAELNAMNYENNPAVGATVSVYTNLVAVNSMLHNKGVGRLASFVLIASGTTPTNRPLLHTALMATTHIATIKRIGFKRAFLQDLGVSAFSLAGGYLISRKF